MAKVIMHWQCGRELELASTSTQPYCRHCIAPTMTIKHYKHTLQ